MLETAVGNTLPGSESFLSYRFHHTIVVEMPENCNHFNRSGIGISGGLKQVCLPRINQCAYLLLTAAFDHQAAAFQGHNKPGSRNAIGTADDF